MPYMQSYRGDYYGRRRGDPFLGSLLPVIAKLGGSLVKRAFSKTVKAAPAILAAGAAGRALVPIAPPGQIPVPGMKGAVQRALPGGQTGFMPRKRKRMNVANPKALRRAIRRQEGFIKLARRTLKGTGYVIKRTGTRAMKKRTR